MARRLLPLASALMLFLVRASSASAATLPDPKLGVIDGRVAIMGLPIAKTTGGEPIPLDARGCQVVLTESGDETRQRSYPCGTWFQPPVGRYLMWLESADAISFQSVIYYAGERFRGAGNVFMKTVHPAGVVQLDPSTPLPPGTTFRLLSTSPVANFRPFDRRIAAAHARASVKMPAGAFVGGVFDSAGTPLALSKRQVVAAGATSRISPVPPPTGRSALLAVLNRFVAEPPLPLCEARLSSGGRMHPRADVELQAWDRIVLLWSELPVSTVDLELRCDGASLLSRRTQLQERGIGIVRTQLPKE